VFTYVDLWVILKYLSLLSWSRVIFEKVIFAEAVKIPMLSGTSLIAMYVGHYPG
jgi:hypothetical protein